MNTRGVLNLADLNNERLLDLDRLTALVEQRADADAEFRRAVGALTDDVQFISAAMRRNTDLWRLNRAFHAVHVPSFIAIMAMLEDIDDMKSIDAEERHQLYSSIHRAAQLGAVARERIEQAALTEAKVELSVLADYAPAHPEEYKKASLLERTRAGVASASSAALQRARSGIEGVPSVASAVKGGVASSLERATGAVSLASNAQRTLSGIVSDRVTNPIGMRIRASGKALRHGAGTGVGLGVAAAVLFPPLVPVSAGAAILVAMRSWRNEMQNAQALGEEARKHRIAELRAERAAALAQLTNGAPSVQMETDELSLTLDTETGEADAMILKGAHAGRMWSELSEDEQRETAGACSVGADVLLNMLFFLASGER